MRAVRNMDDGLSCRLEDAIFVEDDFYLRIRGDSINGYIVEQPQKVENILNVGWSELYPSLEDENEKYSVIAGETNWGGAGFLAVKKNKENSFKWILHLSTMNNPKKIKIENDIVRLTTDLNYPDGLDFVVPFETPEEFKIEKPAANNVQNGK